MHRYANVAELLDLLATRCTKAHVKLDGGQVAELEVEFIEAPVSAAPFVDEKGKPVNLDEGAPELARDPDGDEGNDDAIERANFERDAAS